MHNCLKNILIALSIAAILTISSCGKTSTPEPFEGSGYPHDYPRE